MRDRCRNLTWPFETTVALAKLNRIRGIELQCVRFVPVLRQEPLHGVSL
ncbi:MAG TPA: hypothetical protein VMU78_01015 [Methylocella sp.]|nr:hypothetical protein [Methylocella sp.]